MAYHVCTAAPPPPSSLHSCSLQVFIVLSGRKPRIIPISSHQHKSFLYVGSFICSPFNLVLLLKIWVFFFRFGSRTFCGAPGCDVTTSSHLRAPLRFAVLASFQQVSLRTSLCWVPAVGVVERTGSKGVSPQTLTVAAAVSDKRLEQQLAKVQPQGGVD